MTTPDTHSSSAPIKLGEIKSLHTAELVLRHPLTSAPLGWNWTIAGPGHDVTIQLSNEMMRELLQEERLQEQARVNGKKWKAPDVEPEERRLEAVKRSSRRVIGFATADINGEIVSYSQENLVKFLMKPENGWAFGQLLDFLGEEKSFFAGSAKT